jgi:hypothetical protein
MVCWFSRGYHATRLFSVSSTVSFILSFSVDSFAVPPNEVSAKWRCKAEHQPSQVAALPGHLLLQTGQNPPVQPAPVPQPLAE